MSKARFLAAALAAGALAALPAALPASQAAAQRDWSRIVVATPEGGFRVGNPQAPRKLIEYGSLTCPHCAKFAAEGMPALLNGTVRRGTVSLEFRTYVRDPADMAAALLSRCAGPANFFKLVDGYFTSQDQWLGRAQDIWKTDIDRIRAMPETQRFAHVAQTLGLDTIAAKAGVTPARARQCLTSKAGIDALVAIRAEAISKYNLEGTPTFVLDGRNTGVFDWTALQPLLGAPAG